MDAHLAPAALLVELQQCRDALGREVLTPEMEIVYICISVFLTLFAGLMAGLTLGLLSIDK
jgi:MFS superfamily sulfate permease-like transporter